MKEQFIKSFIRLLTFIVVLGCFKETAILTFSADMIQRVNNRRMEGKIFVKGNEYRMDIVENGEELSILVDRESGKLKVIVHSQKVAQEYLNTSEKSLNNNPFENFKYQLEIGSADTIGSEIINGYECLKIEVSNENRKILTAWISNKLNWPVKIETADKPHKDVDLSNIKEGEIVEADFFKVPEEYTIHPLKEETPKELPDIEKMKEAVLAKVEKNGIELETEEGKIAVRGFGATVLARYFPGWKFFRVVRSGEKKDSIPLGFKPVVTAVVSSDVETIYLLNSPDSDLPIDIGLKIFHSDRIKLNNEKEIETFGNALAMLYFVGVGVRGVEPLGANKWKIALGKPSQEEGFFIITLNRSGEVKGVEYKLKVK